MTTRDKIIKEVGIEQNIRRKDVELLVKSQAQFVRNCMQQKREVSIYLKKVGTFTPRAIWGQIKRDKYNRIKKKIENRNNQEDLQDPYEFD